MGYHHIGETPILFCGQFSFFMFFGDWRSDCSQEAMMKYWEHTQMDGHGLRGYLVFTHFLSCAGLCLGLQLPRQSLFIASVALLKTEADESTVLAIVMPSRYPKTSIRNRQMQVNNVRRFTCSASYSELYQQQARDFPSPNGLDPHRRVCPQNGPNR